MPAEDRTRRSSDGSQTEVSAIALEQGVRTRTTGPVHTVCVSMWKSGGGMNRRSATSHAHKNPHDGKDQAEGFAMSEGFELELSDLGAQILLV